MSLACITAARLRVVSLRLAVAVAVLGGIGPFFGSYEFVREQRQRDAEQPAPTAEPRRWASNVLHMGNRSPFDGDVGWPRTLE